MQCCVLTAFLIFALGCSGGASNTGGNPGNSNSTTQTATVVVDSTKTVTQNFSGFGVQWDPYSYPPSGAEWTNTLARLTYMHPGFFRMVSSATDYCDGFDRKGNPIYVWNEGVSVEQNRLWQIYRMLDYVQANQIPVILGEWAWPGNLAMIPTGSSPIAGPGDPRWARIVADYVNYLVKTKGYTVIRYYNFMNEPNGSWMWPNNSLPDNAFTSWSTGIKNLRADLDAHKLSTVAVIGPDNAVFGTVDGDSSNWGWLQDAATSLASDIGVWDSHWYAQSSDVIAGLVEQTLSTENSMLLKTDAAAAKKPRILGEAGMLDGKTSNDQNPNVQTFIYGVWMADLGTQMARSGYTGASAWDLDDAMHTTGDTLKMWGFWNTYSATGDPAQGIRPWFYTWSLLSRLIPQGATIISSTGSASLSGFRSTAAAWTVKGQKYATVVLVNDSDSSYAITLQSPSLGTQNLIEYDYFSSQMQVDANGLAVAASKHSSQDLSKGMTVNLVSRGVVFLTTYAK
jgi:hypothetical protein